MKRVFFLLLFFTGLLFGGMHFWQNITEVENNFFQKENILKIINEGNLTKALDENQTSTQMDEKFHAFEGIIILLKNEPYSLDKNSTSFFDPKQSDTKINQLKLRIESNRKYGYLQAVKRDKIILQTLQIKRNIFQFFHYLADNWTQLEQKSLIEYIAKNRQELKKVPIKDIITMYKEVEKQKGTVAKQVQKNFFNFAKHYYFFDSFLDYLTINAKLLTYHSIANELQLDNLINYINKQTFFAKTNVYLRYLKTDAGRIILFVGIILFFWLLNYLIYKRLYHYFRSRILRTEDDVDDILIENLNQIRKPVFFLINGIGIELALEVLKYPQPLSDRINLFFYLFFIIIIAYIMMKLVENIFFAYFNHRNASHNKALRGELLNLMLSVAKVLIFLAASIITMIKLGVNITGLLTSLGIGGLAVALAAQTTLSNFFGLLKIVFDESFSQGDWIATKDVEGTVVEIGFISTKIRTFDNALITVPNSELANTPLKNWSRRTIGRRIKMHIGVTYNAKKENLQQAIVQIDKMLKAHPGIVTVEKIDQRSLKKRYKTEGKFVSTDDKFGIKTTHLVYFDQFSASSMDILIYVFTNSIQWEEWLQIKQDVLYKIWEIIENNDLEFAFPSQTLYFDPNNIASSAKEIQK